MAADIRGIVSKPANAQTFAAAFVDGYLYPAFGARSKSEIDLLVFTCLVTAKAISPDAPIYDLARALNITPAKARSLVLNWQLRASQLEGDLRASIFEALEKTRFSKDGTLLSFGVESPLLREDIAARLKKKGIFPDASFAKELVKLPVEAFVEFLDEVMEADAKKAIQTALVKDKQLPDKSFKALATGVLKKLGEKVAGEVGKEIAGDVASKAIKPAGDVALEFIKGLISGDAKGATKNITKDDFIAV